MNIIQQISKLPAGTWQRQYAEIALSNDAQPIVMTDIPDNWFNRFARNQQRTVIYNGRVALELAEFVRLALSTMPDARDLHSYSDIQRTSDTNINHLCMPQEAYA